MEEFMDDSEGEVQGSRGQEDDGDDDDADEGFVYEGVDAGASGSGGYRDRLRDILGSEHAPEDDELDEKEVEKSLLHDSEDKISGALNGREIPHVQVSRDDTPSTPSVSSPTRLSPSRMASPGPTGVPGTPSRQVRPFLHPTISRLRSFTPQASRNPSTTGSAITLQSYGHGAASPAPSHFSAISRSSTPSTLDQYTERPGVTNHQSEADRQVFKWTVLQTISDLLFAKKLTQKAAAVLGSPSLGSPTVMAANGLICIGTDSGRIVVFDFKQSLKAVCGNESSAAAVGPVSAVALSHDHTYVAAGHASGHIQLYDLSKPQTAARFVAPTSIPAVVSGRQEGHLLGSRIVSVGFVAGRHTAIVSADESGLAFFHSLGKVLFVEASDILRILGKYPEEDPVTDLSPEATGLRPGPLANGNGAFGHTFRRRRLRKSNTILSMATLPLGTAPHPTDAYHIVAMLTPVKLVIVGLKPTPKTWFRRHREDPDEKGVRSKWKGTLAWWPSVTRAGDDGANSGKGRAGSALFPTDPILAYSWADTLYLLRVTETKASSKLKNPRNGKTNTVEVGTVTFAEVRSWTTASNADVLALQWLNANQIIVVTPHSLEVHDVRSSKLIERASFDASLLISPTLGYTVNGMVPYADSVSDIAHSVRVYKGKVFLLGRQDVSVGTLLTWADRILHLVQEGDFLSAIELTRTYYTGEAPGNRNGLPDTPEQVKDVIGQKLRDLMTASARFAFSEERLVETHMTPDGRGVDRTTLFEGLVQTCARACKALDDFDFLFEDLFQYYDDCGIARMFLFQLETFVLSGDVRYVPPRITQRLVAMHDDDQRPDLVERVIWHIEPDCLDINQAVRLCKTHQLYDALIYLYTRAMRDYVAPVVELISLVRKVMQYRRARMETSSPSQEAQMSMDDLDIEPIILNAYKIYPYLGDVLSGLTYPSEEPLPEDEALSAKNDVYSFLFFGRSSVWPSGEGGKLVLTAEEDGGVEPTYPYLRLLLRFDSEAFLHSLDLAFEDSYLNDETEGISRMIIINILLEVLSSPGLSRTDITFVNIFVARNIPKYPQYILKYTSPSVMQSVLVGLAEDPDESTREDRQLAAEYLLSAYTPHDSNAILDLFQKAGFYRILRSWHRHEEQWAPLFLAYLNDPELDSHELFEGIRDVMANAQRRNAGSVPLDLLAVVSDAIPRLLQLSIARTASVIDIYVPDLHADAADAMSTEDQEYACFLYLRHLLGRPTGEDHQTKWRGAPSSHVPPSLRQRYIELHCQYDPANVIDSLQYLPAGYVDPADVVRTCEKNQVYDAAVWAASMEGEAASSLSKVQSFETKLASQINSLLTTREGESTSLEELEKLITALQSIGRAGIAVCTAYAGQNSGEKASLEDVWFQLLRSQIDCVQNVSSCCTAQGNDVSGTGGRILSSLRSLVQETFTALMAASSTTDVSFPRLFKRLVDSSTGAKRMKGIPYTEFRAILTGMLESYRSDGDMLLITKHLIDRDVFETTEELVRERLKGWSPEKGICRGCRKALSGDKNQPQMVQQGEQESILVSRTGAIYHSRCHPSDSITITV
ncbi:hypothetical protein GLOTRDRAFT_73888 [Gloeophyllum trabeum ATCC 11539]|uniref:Uncharacterized protein n=1 Tax=Gloeophyllum trabeum (strain ATCC 11539 / FP-39264 / Madison 617) TaxID=670483 RepID=S7QBB8_GLOTA|nr:uncharacterized protein GLOTRDRAFT_73888 [Gloeophyllum trabeum ATCC 11539]EPQ57241.1 hypothetical protein GLOTRDRAFT_73888 [Gloeophyllum trabeum ATCC 11539]